ncbi:hypothetical protein [Mesomycoplasma hyorhinis]|uniref:hypothetical protein n=1 Tax=Mesomycoplasma hyorhinis TaxID=2100 RepID=UPI0012BD2AB3|nr:hypothetical protein [Mesomycoplasma hyorhinis]QPC29526.1 hypothetical protein ISX88_03000 [Mesomycoplasma hyorhinis]
MVPFSSSFIMDSVYVFEAFGSKRDQVLPRSLEKINVCCWTNFSLPVSGFRLINQ